MNIVKNALARTARALAETLDKAAAGIDPARCKDCGQDARLAADETVTWVVSDEVCWACWARDQVQAKHPQSHVKVVGPKVTR